MGIAGIVIGSVSTILMIFSLLGIYAYKNSKDCVDNGNGTSTCYFRNEKIKVPNEFLKDEQMKK